MSTRSNSEIQLLELLEHFKARTQEPVVSARRPAGERVLIETWTRPHGKSTYTCLMDFWVHALFRFLEDSGSDRQWFEGLAYQSKFVDLTPKDFHGEYRELQQELILPPPETIWLNKAYRVLNGRIVSYMGLTEENEFWTGTFGPCYYGD